MIILPPPASARCAVVMQPHPETPAACFTKSGITEGQTIQLRQRIAGSTARSNRDSNIRSFPPVASNNHAVIRHAACEASKRNSSALPPARDGISFEFSWDGRCVQDPA